MSEVNLKCKSKATVREGDQLQWSLNWAFARRGELRFTDRAIECGDWTISYKSIEDAVLMVIPTLLFTAYNMHVKSRRQTYQFQLKSPPVWGWKCEPFPVEEAPFAIRKEFAGIG